MITEIIKDSLKENLKELGINALTDQISLERPANREHGDWSSNIALVTAKNAGRQARELAEEIVNSLIADLPDGVTEVTVAGPGFINFRISAELSYEILLAVLEKESRYGSSNRGQEHKSMLNSLAPIPQALFTQATPEVPATEMQSATYLNTWVTACTESST